MNKYIKLSILLGSFALLSVYGFNCAQKGMHGVGYEDQTSLSSSGAGAGGMVHSGTPFSESSVDATKNLPVALNNSEQVLQSMLNVTGVTISTRITNEYGLRTGSFADNNLLSSVNSPLLLSATSLAGEVCGVLLDKETAKTVPPPPRVYFANVNFSTGPKDVAASFVYRKVVDKMAHEFWGRDLASDELAIMDSYYSDFINTSANDQTQTRNLYLSTCAAMLSSFDALTF